MLIRTETVKESEKSIGMFSRYGKITTIHHPIFREKKERATPKSTIENELYKRFLNQEPPNTKEKSNKNDTSLDGSFYFRSVSREKSEPKRSKTPDIGRYRPKYEMTEPKVIYYPTSREKVTHACLSDQNTPMCVKHGAVCDFKARQLAKKIEVMRDEINSSGADIESLYKSHLISKAVYNMFKSPSLKLLKNDADEKSGQDNQDQNSNMVDMFDPALQKAQGVINQIVSYNNLKEEYKRLTQHNIEKLEKESQAIPEKVRGNLPTPVPFGLQITRPPMIRPPSPSESRMETSEVTEENEMNKTFGQTKFRNTCNFAHYSRRRSLFNNKDASLVFYDYDKFKLSKVDRNKPVPQFYKTVSRQTPDAVNGSMTEYNDLLKSFYHVAKKTDFAFDMKKVTKRKLTFPKGAAAPIQQCSSVPRTPQMFYSVHRSPDVSFISPANRSFL